MQEEETKRLFHALSNIRLLAPDHSDRLTETFDIVNVPQRALQEIPGRDNWHSGKPGLPHGALWAKGAAVCRRIRKGSFVKAGMNDKGCREQANAVVPIKRFDNSRRELDYSSLILTPSPYTPSGQGVYHSCLKALRS